MCGTVKVSNPNTNPTLSRVGLVVLKVEGMD